jgi:STE24 endopeptidase
MNESKAARYHRLRRRASFASGAAVVAVLAALLWWRPPIAAVPYVLLVAVVCELVSLPAAFYRGHVLERRFGLASETAAAWLADHAKAFGVRTAFGLAGVWVVYSLIRWTPWLWWLPAAVAASLATVLFARLAPVLLLPLFFTFKPLERPQLAERLAALSTKAGIRVLGIYEWVLGAKTRRANAALTGSGSTRRILVSDTLLADYTDDEIEVVLAHEIGHHVHRDIPKALAVEFVLLLVSFYAAAGTLAALWQPLALAAPSDLRGLPLLLLVVGGVLTLATPIVNALSRWNERRADRFALALTGREDAFVSAMRRLGSQNLVEENPSRATVWLFHTHPPIEERIAEARLINSQSPTPNLQT